MEKSNESKTNYRIKYKFLRRKAVIQSQEQHVLAKIRQKGLFLKKLDLTHFTANTKPYLKAKQIKYLRTLELNGGTKLKHLRLVRQAIILKHISIHCISGKSFLENIGIYLKHIVKDLESLSLKSMFYYDTVPQIQHLYRGIGAFSKLKVLRKMIGHCDKEDRFSKNEYKLIKQYFSRLRNLKVFAHKQIQECIAYGSRRMMDGQICPYVTALSLIVNAPIFGEIDDNDQDGENNQNIDSKLDESNSTNDRTLSLVRFELFPNLQKLDITFREDADLVLSSSVIKGFESLQKLEYLTITLHGRPADIKPLFEGLSRLPSLLIGFSFTIPYLKPSENFLLSKFYCHQARLVFLHHKISSHLKSQAEFAARNRYLENMWQHLNLQTTLKYLTLLSKTGWTLESLSKCLKKTGTMNQLRELQIDIFDNSITSTLSPTERVAGLYDFIARHKKSLQTLKICIRLVKEEEILLDIIKSISQLEYLRKLELTINPPLYTQRITKFFARAYKSSDEVLNKPLHFNQAFICLDQELRKLSKLSELEVNILTGFNEQEVCYVDSSVVFNVLPYMKSLEKLNLYLVFLEEAIDKHPDQVLRLLELERLLSVDIKGVKPYRIDAIEKVEQILAGMKQRQQMRNGLTF